MFTQSRSQFALPGIPWESMGNNWKEIADGDAMMSKVLGRFEVRPVSGALGAEVVGVPFGRMTEADHTAVRELLLEHLVLFFPDAEGLEPEAHIEFGRWFGELEIHPFLPKLP